MFTYLLRDGLIFVRQTADGFIYDVTQTLHTLTPLPRTVNKCRELDVGKPGALSKLPLFVFACTEVLLPTVGRYLVCMCSNDRHIGPGDGCLDAEQPGGEVLDVVLTVIVVSGEIIHR